MKKKTLYLCGAVTSNKNYFYDFLEQQIRLEKAGYKVLNPVDICLSNGLTNWEECMRLVLPIMITDSEGVALIPSELPSKGRDLELQVAEALSIEIHTVDEWEKL